MVCELCEVAVAGNLGASFGDGKRRVLRVGDELSCCRNEPAQFQDVVQVMGTRDDHSALRVCAELFDRSNRNPGRGWRCVDSGVRYDAQESDRNQYTERERLRSVEPVFEPAAIGRVGLFVGAMGIHQHVYVRHQHGSSSA